MVKRKKKPEQKKTKKKLKKGKKKQIRENKILRNVIFGIIVLVIFVLIFSFLINSSKSFEYEGVKFNVVKAGEIIFYQTSFPLIDDGRELTYNVYLRKDPRVLKDVDFDGEVNLLEMMVLDNTESFVCGGDGGIATINFQQILMALGTTVIKDPDASCDSQGRFMFVKIQPGEETGIKQFGPACYEINIKDCEILDGTERFLVETLIELNKLI